MAEYDVAVIGAGPGGYVAAIRAAQLGARTVVVERAELGGVCLNWGCIPTKTLLHTADLYRRVQHAADYGIKVKGLSLDMKALLARKNAVIDRNKAGIRALFKAHGIEVVKGCAHVAGPGHVVVDRREIAARSIIVATGAGPAALTGLETDGKRVITSTEALELSKPPKRAVVIGAGPLGAEFACLWNALGAEVTLVEMMPHVLPQEDEEISRQLAASLEKRGMDVRTQSTVKKLDVDKGVVRVELEGAKTKVIETDLVLVGIGVAHHSEVVTQTKSLGVQVGKRGEILVNERMETSVRGLFAVGDVVGKTMLAHGASAEGVVAAENAMGHKRTMNYRTVPHCTFTHPEVASVGLTEKQAREAGIDVRVGRFSFLGNGRAHTMGEIEGLAKIIGDSATDEVIGVHIVGCDAGELIACGALAMTMEATVEEIAHTVHTHPTLSEVIKEAAEDYLGRGIHTLPRKK